MNSLTTFAFNDNDIRITDRDGNPWFVAADVCKTLTLGNTSMAVAILNPTEISHLRLNGGRYGRPSLIISESGLYKLILRSDKPQAKPFQDWVTKVVLPAIRKTGPMWLARRAKTQDDVSLGWLPTR